MVLPRSHKGHADISLIDYPDGDKSAFFMGLFFLISPRVIGQGPVWFIEALLFFVIVGLAYGLHTVALYPLLKYSIAVMIAVPCCFVLSALVRRIPYAKRIL